jgi:hypothetical protein
MDEHVGSSSGLEVQKIDIHPRVLQPCHQSTLARQSYNAILEKEKQLELEEAAHDEPALMSKALFGDLCLLDLRQRRTQHTRRQGVTVMMV